jgi:hypothetical protein
MMMIKKNCNKKLFYYKTRKIKKNISIKSKTKNILAYVLRKEEISSTYAIVAQIYFLY